MGVAAPLVKLLAVLLAISACTAAPSKHQGAPWTQQERSLSLTGLLGPDSKRPDSDGAQQIVNRHPQGLDRLPPEDRRFLQRALAVPVSAGRPAWVQPYDLYYWGHHGHKHHGHKHHKRHGPEHHRSHDRRHRRVPRSLGNILRNIKLLGRGIKVLSKVHNHYRRKSMPGYQSVYMSGAGQVTPAEHPYNDWPDERDGGATTDTRWPYPGWQDPREAAARADPGWARPDWPHDPMDVGAGSDPGWSDLDWQDPRDNRNDPGWSDPGWSNPDWLSGRDGGAGADPRWSDPHWSHLDWTDPNGGARDDPDPGWSDPDWNQ